MTLFIHLRVHSQYSVGESSLNLYKIQEFIKKDSSVAIALTDTNNMFGVREFSAIIAKQNIKPIIGVQLNIIFKGLKGNIVLLAKNENGYKNLLHLHESLYKNFKNDNEDTPYIDLDYIIQHSQNLVLLTGGLDGLLANFINNNSSEVESLVEKLKNAFNDNLYIELNRFFLQEDVDLEKEFLTISTKYNLPIVATNNAKFIDPAYYKSTEILTCIGEGLELSNPNRKKLPEHSYLKSSQEMVELFKDLPEAIENTVNIAKKCNYFVDKKDLALPNFADNENDLIKQQAIDGLKDRLEKIVYKLSNNKNKEDLDKIYFDRLNFELDVIIKMGFSGYF